MANHPCGTTLTFSYLSVRFVQNTRLQSHALHSWHIVKVELICSREIVEADNTLKKIPHGTDAR